LLVEYLFSFAVVIKACKSGTAKKLIEFAQNGETGEEEEKVMREAICLSLS
jgi:hypothetical protein